jgi:hypothetical protein
MNKGGVHLQSLNTMKMNKKHILIKFVNKLYIATKKAAWMRTVTTARKTCSFFFGFRLGEPL